MFLSSRSVEWAAFATRCSVDHPDKSSGAASASERELYTVDALGQDVTYQDRNGNVHTYTLDVLGRLTSDAITTLGSGAVFVISRRSLPRA
jgi:YD repeat-containing protein